jgi:transcriptional regulator with XRE-family HTH domain
MIIGSTTKAWPKKQVRLYSAVGLQIREIRIEKGITQEALAKKVKLTRTSLTNIEKGRQKLLLHTLMDIASALDAPAAELLRAKPQSKIS